MDSMNVSFNDEKKSAIKLNTELFDSLVDEFNRRFPDQDSALAEVKARLEDKASKCCYCSEQLRDVPGARELICDHCHGKNWVTARSPFRGVKTQIRAWLAAVWLRERGAVLTSPRFAAALHCSGSTAQNILKKTGYAILKTMEQGAEDKTIFVSTAEFLEIYCKRSQETPRRQHPSTEQKQAESEHNADEDQPDSGQAATSSDQSEDEEEEEVVAVQQASTKENAAVPIKKQLNEDASTKNSLLSMLRKEEIEVLNLLDENQVKTFNQLMIESSLEFNKLNYAISILEIEGMVKRLPGNSYLKIASNNNKQKRMTGATFSGADFRMVIEDFINHIKTFSHGISRKTVQLYFAIYWYYCHREQLPESWLSKIFFRQEAISDRKLLEFVSPLKIQYWKIELAVRSS